MLRLFDFTIYGGPPLARLQGPLSSGRPAGRPTAARACHAVSGLAADYKAGAQGLARGTANKVKATGPAQPGLPVFTVSLHD